MWQVPFLYLAGPLVSIAASMSPELDAASHRGVDSDMRELRDRAYFAARRIPLP